MRVIYDPIEGQLRRSVSLRRKLDRELHSYILTQSGVSKRGLRDYHQKRRVSMHRATHMTHHQVLQ